MKQLDEYRKQHDELMELVTVLRTLLVEDQIKVPANAHTAHHMLRDLTDRVSKHLTGEDRELYPPLLVNGNPQIKSMAWGFIRGESPLRKSFENYGRKWLKGSELDTTGAFLDDTREVLDALAKRIETEQEKLFPLLEQAGLYAKTD